MFYFLHFLLIATKSEAKHVISMGFVDSFCSDEEQKIALDYLEDMRKDCAVDPSIEDCEMVLDYDLQMSNGKDFKSFLSSFSESTDTLYLDIYKYDGEIDFNDLKNTKSVSLLNANPEIEPSGCNLIPDDDIGSKMLNEKEKRENKKKFINKIKRISQKILNQTQKKKKNERLKLKPKAIGNSHIQIVGNIREKVPFLNLFLVIMKL